MATYIGIDISKDTFDAATSEQKQSIIFKNTEAGYKKFKAWISKLNEPHVCMEATGKYYLGLATSLYEQGIPVSVVNPLRIKRYAQSGLNRVKTDSEDAKVIAQFCKTEKLVLWAPDKPVIQELQEWYKLKDLLTRQQTQFKNQLKSGLNSRVRKVQEKQIQQIEKSIKAVVAKIKECIQSDKELCESVKLLESITSIGEKTAMDLITFIKDIKRFDKAKNLASFAGLTPQIIQSGTSVNSSRLSKMGNANLRKCLYMPAINAMAYNVPLKRFADGLRAKGVASGKIKAAVMRKLIHIVFAVLNSGKPFDPEYKMCV